MVEQYYPKVVVAERDLYKAVYDAMVWLHEHPHRDYIDAAYIVAAGPSRDGVGQKFSTGRWSELIEAVKIAAHDNSLSV